MPYNRSVSSWAQHPRKVQLQVTLETDDSKGILLQLPRKTVSFWVTWRALFDERWHLTQCATLVHQRDNSPTKSSSDFVQDLYERIQGQLDWTHSALLPVFTWVDKQSLQDARYGLGRSKWVAQASALLEIGGADNRRRKQSHRQQPDAKPPRLWKNWQSSAFLRKQAAKP